MLNKATFVMGWELLEKHYKRQGASSELLNLYYEIFKDLSDDQFHEGVKQTLLNERFLPPLQTIIDYGKALTKSLPPEQRLFIAPAEDNYDPESADMVEARGRARGIVQSAINLAADLTQDKPQAPTESTLDGLADLLEQSGPDAVQQRLEVLGVQGVIIKMSTVEEHHTQRYGQAENMAKLASMLSQNFLKPLTNKDVDNMSEDDSWQN